MLPQEKNIRKCFFKALKDMVSPKQIHIIFCDRIPIGIEHLHEVIPKNTHL